MNKRGKWSVLFLGLLLSGTGGMSMADRGQGTARPGGQSAQARPGGQGAQARPDRQGAQARPGGRDAQVRYGRPDRRPGGYDRHDGRSHWGVGVVVNPFWYDSWYAPGPYYYPPYYPYSPYPYYPPAVVTVPATPPIYIEREDDSAATGGTSAYWYYCADPQGYYPDVRECPGGWRAVSPRPDGEER